MIDHEADDAGYNMPTESTLIDATDERDGITEFCCLMKGERFEIIDVTLES
jgi:hypothetical protein